MNDARHFTIPERFAGERLDRVLAQLLPEWSRSQLTTWLKTGMIVIDDQMLAPDRKIWGGETVVFQLQADPQSLAHQAEAIALDIIFEDDHLIILNKPAGLIVHPGAGNASGTLLNALLHHDPKLAQVPRAGIVHRLDKDTSGILIIAKTLAAHTQLIRQMQAHAIQRQYVAVVYGHVIAGQTIQTAYGRDPRNRLKMAVCKQGKPAITEFHVRQNYHYATVLNVLLHTGRTHQIRVHMAYLKHAIIGDPLYRGRQHSVTGIRPELRAAIGAFPRQALHAESLRLTHPILGTPLHYSADVPADLQSLLTLLAEEEIHAIR